ncbi:MULTISPECIES: hypothetical protein [unclassified Pseudoalteromonas]|uniref:hypothetical protein n=1 Tax=unclassified Pseudoalteromonas TaxID=194690 RepID=UPI001B3A0E8A|nr:MULTISPECIES: hypothetical protein [unclassified Pseudoalteromonas]MBQ4845979.1 hypothetical protein [Pseudoalteromonas sp. MMG005]MBQ4852527.1 hypothetical protein [Pseudoalteromonas sp. MMG012]
MKTLLTTWFTSRMAKSRPRPNKGTRATEACTHSQWKDTGKVYYVLETLKISYVSNNGDITFENLSEETVASLILDIYEPGNAQLTPKVIAGVQSCLHISVCGISWQENGSQLRIKAIPNAAVLRTRNSIFSNSQAQFQHASFAVDESTLEIPERAATPSIFTYRNIDLAQFISQLKQANAALPDTLPRKPPICRNNFMKVYSEHEASILTQLSSV